MNVNMHVRCVSCFCAVAVVGALLSRPADAREADPLAAGVVQRLLVKRRTPTGSPEGVVAGSFLRRLSESAAIPLARVRRMSGGAEVVQLPRAMTATQAQAIAERLMQDPSVESAEPDRSVRPLVLPSDADYALQWYLQGADSEIAAANLPDAWEYSRGDASVVIAVLDTGLVTHSELDGGRIYPGYDFVSDIFMANDGDGRDADPSDPGDWTNDADVSTHSICAGGSKDSSWHGTVVTGVVAASTNNGIGVAGVNWNSRLLPVRVLGKCGGYLSDVLDGMRWAAGVHDRDLPPNPHPARVLNLSLGAATACTPLVQSAINDALAAGAVIIAAAGNNAGDAAGIAPGNCAGVIAVTALDRTGGRAYYASTGTTVALAAPGGAQAYVNDASGILSLFNTGTTAPLPSPDGDTYSFVQGTSMSAPQVAGAASLMLSVNPLLTPAQVRRKLQATARSFPAGSTCSAALCGAGMLDATRAVQSAANTVPPVAEAGTDQTVVTNDTVALDGTSSVAATPASIAQYSWIQLRGVPVVLADAGSVSPTFVAPAQATTLSFQLTVVDDGNLTAADTVTVEVTAPAGAAHAVAGNVGAGDSRCFIATAAYGTPEAADVRRLRRFRDRYLLTNAVGRAFVRVYYRLSPPFANAVRPYPLLRKLIRVGLIPYVTLARWLTAEPSPVR